MSMRVLKSVRMRERVPTRDARTTGDMLSVVTLEEVAADVARQIKNPVLNLGAISDGLHSMITTVAAALEPSASKRVLDDVFSRMQGAPTEGTVHTPAMTNDGSLRSMRTAASRDAAAVNRNNADFWDKHRSR